MPESTECWMPIPSWEGIYEASDLGRIKSLARIVRSAKGIRLVRERILKPSVANTGYLVLNLCRDGKHFSNNVHVLVLSTFVGPHIKGMAGRHLNDVKIDNRLENLAWGTYSENEQDKLRNGHNYYANRTHCKYGHEFTPENTRYTQSGARRCTACRMVEQRGRRKAKREAAGAPRS